MNFVRITFSFPMKFVSKVTPFIVRLDFKIDFLNILHNQAPCDEVPYKKHTKEMCRLQVMFKCLMGQSFTNILFGQLLCDAIFYCSTRGFHDREKNCFKFL